MTKHISRKQLRQTWKQSFERRKQNVSIIKKQEGIIAKPAAPSLEKINEDRQKHRDYIKRLRDQKQQEIEAARQERIKKAQEKQLKLNAFESEYQNFIAKLKAEQAAKEAEKVEVVEETVVVEAPKVEPEVVEEPILSPEQTYVETEVTETLEPNKVDVIELVEEKPLRKTKKKKIVEETTEE